MAFKGVDFQPYTNEQADPYGNALTKSIQNRLRRAEAEKQEAENPYVGRKALADSIHQELTNQFYEPNIKSEIGYRNAESNKMNQMTPLEVEEQRIKNKFGEEREKAGIAEKGAMAEYYKTGGSKGGVFNQTQGMLTRQVKQDNPNFTDEQAFQASGALLEGKNTLPDGTPINASGLTLNTASKAALSGTTSNLATTQVKANQAEAELKVLNDYAQKGLEPYGDTGLLNMNSKQVIDSFKSDDASQERLGRFVASQALQYEAAQNRIKLANGQPGVTSTEELMRMSGQQVNAKYPNLSYKARKEAARYMDEALHKGLEARKKVGIRIAGATNSKDSTEDSNEGLIEFARDANGNFVRKS